MPSILKLKLDLILCVATCCHRMMYGKGVVQCNKSKYTKTSPDLLTSVFCADLLH